MILTTKYKFCFGKKILKSTYGPVKLMITMDRDYGLAEWIKIQASSSSFQAPLPLENSVLIQMSKILKEIEV